MRIAREGIPIVAGLLAAGGTGVLLGALLPGLVGGILLVLGLPALGLAVFSLWFFRDPERTPPEGGAGMVVSPADGRVVAVVDDPAGPALAIFLSVFDVHVNRAPIAGRIEAVTYTEGRFLAAFNARAGEQNERNEIVVAGSGGSVRVRQIAGAIARRIVCHVKAGDRVGLGERFGLIRFGSRTDLRLPPGSTILVKVGDRVKGGAMVVARMPPGGATVPAGVQRP